MIKYLGNIRKVENKHLDKFNLRKQAHKARRCDSRTIEWLNNRTARLLGLLGLLGLQARTDRTARNARTARTAGIGRLVRIGRFVKMGRIG